MRRAECAVLSRAGARALRSLRGNWACAQLTPPSPHGNRARLRPHGQVLFSGTLLSADPLRSWWACERDVWSKRIQSGVRAVDVTDLSAGRWAPRRLRAIWWQEGLHGVFGRALALLGWRRYLVYMRPLDEPVAIPTAMPKVDLNELGPDDLDQYAAFRPGVSIPILSPAADGVYLLRRLAEGSDCGRYVDRRGCGSGRALASHLPARSRRDLPDQLAHCRGAAWPASFGYHLREDRKDLPPARVPQSDRAHRALQPVEHPVPRAIRLCPHRCRRRILKEPDPHRQFPRPLG